MTKKLQPSLYMNKYNAKIFPFAPDNSSIIGENRRAYLLYFLCWTWVVIITLLLMTRVLLNHIFLVHDTVIILCMDFAFGIALLVNKKGHSVIASYIFIGACILLTTGAALVSGGVKTPAMMTYLPTIFAGGILLGKRGGIVTAIVCVLITFAMVMLQTYGLLPETPLFKNPFSFWLGFVASAAVIGVLQYISNHQASEAFEK